MNSDGSYLGAVENIEFDNLIQKASIVYYFNPNMYAGIFIDIHPDEFELVRRVYSLSGWLGEVGGFSSAVQAIFTVVLPLLQVFSLEKYLISKLYQ